MDLAAPVINGTDMANEIFHAEPDRMTSYPLADPQSVLAALRQDVSAGRHLLCLIGPAGSGKTTLLRALRQGFQQGLVGLIEQPTPGRLLADVATSLQLHTPDENESSLRRRLVMLLSMMDQQSQPIIEIVDAADRLPREDINLLLHFFPPGHATLILAGSAAPETWLVGCATSAGVAHIDRCYRLEAPATEETASTPEPESIAVPISEPVSEPVFESVRDFRRGTHARRGRPTAPAFERRRGDVSRPHSFVAPQDVHYVAESPPPRRMHRLRRSLRLWRALTILTAAALAIVLSKEMWIDRILPNNGTALGGLAELLAEPGATGRAARQSVQPKADHRPVAPPKQQEQKQPDPAGRNSDFAALQAPPFLPVHPEKPPPPGPRILRTPQSTPTDSATPEDVRKPDTDTDFDPPADAARQTAKPDREDTDTRAAISAPAKKVSPRARVQRPDIARLYAKRAEYEWRNGELGAAYLSIRRGLANDPDNPRLLEMRALMRGLMEDGRNE